MKTSKITAISTKVESTALFSTLPPKKKTEVEEPAHFGEDDDEFDLSVDDDLGSLDDLDLDDDDDF